MEAESEELLSCESCPKVFKKRMDYNRHRKSHERPHQCTICDKSFGLRTDLQRHRSTHQAHQFKFQCKIPGCKFRGTPSQKYLRKHMRKSHPGTESLAVRKTFQTTYVQETLSAERVWQAEEKNLKLLDAASQGDESRVKELLSSSADALYSDSRGTTAASLAFEKGHLDTFKLLVQAGADVNVNKKDPWIHQTLRNRDYCTTEMLIKFGANPNAKHFRGNTAVEQAIIEESLDTLKLLAKAGADLRVGPEIMRDGNLTCLAELLKLGTKIENYLDSGQQQTFQEGLARTRLPFATAEGRLAIATLFIRNSVEIVTNSTILRSDPKVLRIHFVLDNVCKDRENVTTLLMFPPRLFSGSDPVFKGHGPLGFPLFMKTSDAIADISRLLLLKLRLPSSFVEESYVWKHENWCRDFQKISIFECSDFDKFMNDVRRANNTKGTEVQFRNKAWVTDKTPSLGIIVEYKDLGQLTLFCASISDDCLSSIDDYEEIFEIMAGRGRKFSLEEWSDLSTYLQYRMKEWAPPEIASEDSLVRSTGGQNTNQDHSTQDP